MERFTACQAGHKDHDTLRIDLQLGGKHHGILDVASIPERFARKLKFEVYNFRKYFGFKGFCYGQDVTSGSIYTQGIWEASETLLMLEILEKGNKDNLVLDFGSQVGWYSVLAALSGHKVFSFEAIGENIDLMMRNAYLNDVADGVITPILGWIDETTYPFLTIKNVEFFKSDIEGSDKESVRMCDHLFRDRRVNYALIEISPCFNDSYPELVKKVADYGYGVYRIPDKGSKYLAEFENAALDTAKKYCQIPYEKIEETVKSISQENWLFIKQ